MDFKPKLIYRIHLNGGKKYIALFDVQKNEVKKELHSLNDRQRFEGWHKALLNLTFFLMKGIILNTKS